MSTSRFNVEPKVAIPWIATLATGGMAAYFASKSRRETQRAELSEKVERQVKKDATHDELTKVLNKRGLREVLAGNRPPRAMLYADSTHLKEVNDAYGHDRGDEAIIATAEILKASLRPGDIIARTGEGDEFLALLDPGPQASSRYPLEKDRRSDRSYLEPGKLLEPVISRVALETQEFLSQPENADLLAVGFDIAVGGAVWEQGMSIDDLRNAADAAMYSAKEVQHQASGGNPR